MIDISFIIPSYNSYQTIHRTLKSIFSQKLFSQIKEIIVVDCSDDQKTRELIKDPMFPLQGNSKLKIILLEKKTSPALGRNCGAKHASGELLCFIDSDVILADDWLGKVFEAYQAGCMVGAGSVSVPDFQKDNQLALAQLYLQCNESLDAGKTRSVVTVPGCNIFIKRAFFEREGGFPDLRAAEEVVLCLKLGEYTKVWFVPGAKCFHVFRENLRGYFNNQKILGKYIIIYRRMMYPKWYYQDLWPVLLLPGFLLIKVLRIKLRIYKAGWGHYKKFFISSPLFMAGLFYWALGFLQGCFEKGINDD